MAEVFLGDRRNKGGVGWFWGCIIFLSLGLSGFAAYKACVDPGFTVAYLVISFEDSREKKETPPSYDQQKRQAMRITGIKKWPLKEKVINSGKWTPVF